MWFARLFAPWPTLKVEETRLGCEEPELLLPEVAQIAQAVSSRRIEFATGRACARRALARLPVSSRPNPEFALLNGPDRAPVWPVGVVGAITHTGRAPAGYCGVAVGRSVDLRAVGLDVERALPLGGELWPSVLTPTEQSWLAGFDGVRAGMLAKLMFSAKECFYKAQFPLSRRFLGFGEVEITLDPASSTFDARLTEYARKNLPLVRCSGRYAESEEFIFTGIALAAEAPSADPRAEPKFDPK